MTLEPKREVGEVGLEPVLLGVLRGRGLEAADHGVDGLFQFQNFALGIDRDFLLEVALGHGGGDGGDVADLVGEVGRHAIDIVGQFLPGAGHALDLSLAAELALGADLARHARHLAREHAELIDHRVDGLAGAEELPSQRVALNFEEDFLREVALGHGADDAGNFVRSREELSDEGVDVLNLLGPGTLNTAEVHKVFDLAILVDELGDALNFAGEFLFSRDTLVERFGDLAVDTGPLDGKADGEVAVVDGGEGFEEKAGVELAVGVGGLRVFGGHGRVYLRFR